MEGDFTGAEELSYYWHSFSLFDHLSARGDFAPNYYNYQFEFSEYYFKLESCIPDEQLSGSDLIRDRYKGQSSKLERIISNQFIEAIEKRVNRHIDFGFPLYNSQYPERAAEYQLTETIDTEKGFYYSVETIKYPRENIELYRKTILYLRAIVIHSLDTLATKRALLQELHPFEEFREDCFSVFDETLYTRNLVREYIEDLDLIKKLIVRLLCWLRVLDLVRYDLIRRLVFIEKLFVKPEHPIIGRRYLPEDICKVINSYVVGVREVEEGGFSTRNEAFLKWSPGKLEYTYEKLLKKSYLLKIDFNLSGAWINPVASCLLEVSENISVLSYDTNYELDYPDEEKNLRSPWSDIKHARFELVHEIEEPNISEVYNPTRWLGKQVLTARFDRSFPREEEEEEIL